MCTLVGPETYGQKLGANAVHIGGIMGRYNACGQQWGKSECGQRVCVCGGGGGEQWGQRQLMLVETVHVGSNRVCG